MAKQPRRGVLLGRECIAQTRAAQRRIARWVQRTPLTLVRNGLYAKREDLQESGSFKVRGVANVLASAAATGRLPKELAVVSSGNTALAACHLAAAFNVGVKAYLPRFVSTAKRKALCRAGARIKLVEGGFGCAAREAAAVPGAMVISPGADADFAIGNATICAEVFDDIPDVAQIVVPCGGGGLIVGIGSYARAVRMSVRVVGVQLKESPHLYRLYTRLSGIIGDRATEVDSLAGDLEPEALAYAHIRRVCNEFRLVAEDEIRRATVTLSEMLQARLDPGAGAALAALGPEGDAGITCLIVTGRER